MPSTEDYVKYLYEYFTIDNLIEFNGLEAQLKGDYTNDFIESTILFVKHFKLNLRQIERLFTHLKVIYTTYKPAREIDPSVYVLFAILKLKENHEIGRGLYQVLKDRSIDEQGLLDILAEIIPAEFYSKYRGMLVETMSHLYNNEMRTSDQQHPELTKREEGAGAFSLPLLDYSKFDADPKRIADTLNYLRRNSQIRRTTISAVIAHIELSKKYFQQ